MPCPPCRSLGRPGPRPAPQSPGAMAPQAAPGARRPRPGKLKAGISRLTDFTWMAHSAGVPLTHLPTPQTLQTHLPTPQTQSQTSIPNPPAKPTPSHSEYFPLSALALCTWRRGRRQLRWPGWQRYRSRGRGTLPDRTYGQDKRRV